MANVFNQDQVIHTLKLVQPVLQKYTRQYWFMGSMVPTAMNGGLYREVHDFDIIVNTDTLSDLLSQIYSLGYKKKPLNFFRVSELLGVYVFSHKTLLDIGFFVIHEEGQIYTINAGPVRVSIPKNNLKTNMYTLRGMSFPGIQPSYAYRLMLLAKHNPKRQKELLIYQSHDIHPANWPFYDFRVWGRNANWIMNMLNSSLAALGRTRVALGLPYDPWQ